MDKALRSEIVAVVTLTLSRELRHALTDKMELYGEKWVTGNELCEMIGCFSRSWLKSYGHTLPRAQIMVTEDATGDEHRTGWCYPLHKIQRLLSEGKLAKLKV